MVIKFVTAPEQTKEINRAEKSTQRQILANFMYFRKAATNQWGRANQLTNGMKNQTWTKLNPIQYYMEDGHPQGVTLTLLSEKQNYT